MHFTCIRATIEDTIGIGTGGRSSGPGDVVDSPTDAGEDGLTSLGVDGGG
jgi:hypothetical protein